MSQQSERFKHETLVDTQSIVDYLKAITEGFQNNALRLGADADQLDIHPQGLINMEVEAKRKGDDVKMTVKFRWAEEEAAGRVEAGNLEIAPGAKKES
jgi:amphi-Trp domain-containing protein